MARPRIEFDYNEVRKLGELQCTYMEVAAFFECSIETIKRRLAEDEEFCAAYKMGLENGKMSLRRYQWRAAQKGNTSMLIWLGKQYLGQRDQPKDEDDTKEKLDRLVQAIESNLQSEAAPSSK